MVEQIASSIIAQLMQKRAQAPPQIAPEDPVGSKPLLQISELEITALCRAVRAIFMSQPVLLQLQAPICICGDVHGQFHDLLRIFEIVGAPPSNNFLFLGDYVDRGKWSLETILLLMAFKFTYPHNFFLLRGNHEAAAINRQYGFYDECKRRFSVKLWKTFTDTFNCLPVAATVDNRIFCCHGGISPDLTSLSMIDQILRPTDVPDTGILCDMLWADPHQDDNGRPVNGWAHNDRGVSWVFGPNQVKEFNQRFGFDLVCRAHQVVQDGYEFYAERGLVTVFSAPNYCLTDDNSGAVLMVDKDLVCSFRILQPLMPARK